ncbi:hypothetical protein HBB16_12000 [Pseudonocardia sp. MCCB 268]|nr:hypothetical protein [Pseudonocardia cytotoxica]
MQAGSAPSACRVDQLRFALDRARTCTPIRHPESISTNLPHHGDSVHAGPRTTRRAGTHPPSLGGKRTTTASVGSIRAILPVSGDNVCSQLHLGPAVPGDVAPPTPRPAVCALPAHTRRERRTSAHRVGRRGSRPGWPGSIGLGEAGHPSPRAGRRRCRTVSAARPTRLDAVRHDAGAGAVRQGGLSLRQGDGGGHAARAARRNHPRCGTQGGRGAPTDTAATSLP